MASEILSTKVQTPEPASRVPIIIVGAILVLGAAAFYYIRETAPSGPPPMVLSPEAKAYVKNLKLAEVGMKATDSYMGGAVVEITGKITNNGPSNLKQVDLYCVFYDTMSQVVLREPVSIVRARSGGLAPGATKDFRLPFDNLPQSWNNDMPQLVIGQIVF